VNPEHKVHPVLTGTGASAASEYLWPWRRITAMAQRNAIVCLTRGYTDLRGYDALIERNRSIYQVINRHRARQYPVIVFHEGNLSPGHQSYIAAQDSNRDLRFVDISPVFQLPEDIREQDLMESWTPGYRLMCRFHSYFIWRYVAPFDYVMRLDEDCILTSAAFDPIQSLSAAGGDFASADFTEEPHELTNRTLPLFVIGLAAALQPGISRPRLYNQSFPYTNFYVTRTAFWRQRAVQRFLCAIVRNPDFIRFRWGDAPVLGIALNMFASDGKVYRASQIGYWHGSHNWAVEPKA
jgi:hypothetical protein